MLVESAQHLYRRADWARDSAPLTMTARRCPCPLAETHSRDSRLQRKLVEVAAKLRLQRFILSF